ncbi:MAG: Rossmann-like domain-containing protein [Promethearchaeia archaeon]
MSTFIKNTKKELESKLEGEDLPETDSVLIGRKYLAVLLEGTLGACFAPRKDNPTCTVFKNPGELCEMNARELLKYVDSDSLIERGVGIATINALSQFYIQNHPGEYYNYELDILKLLPVKKDRTVGMVGRIRPFIKFLEMNSAKLTVVDDNPAFEAGKVRDGYFISRDINDIEDVDVLIVTGSSAVEHSVEKPLKIAKDAIFKVSIGPTSSWIPDVAFDLGLDAVSGMQFTAPEKAFRTIMEGGGTRYFARYAIKYTLTKEDLSNK